MYHVIRKPIDIEEGKHARPFLGKSEKGYMMIVECHNNLGCSALWEVARLNSCQQIGGPWILEDDNKVLPEENCEWHSGNDNVMMMKVVMKTDSVALASCDEEVVFLAVPFIGIPQRFNSVLYYCPLNQLVFLCVCFVIATK